MANRRKSVLCIGNDPVHLNLRCSLLKEHGWRALSAGSGHEGVIRFGREGADAVILDLGGDGAEAALMAGELKRLRPRVPVIMVVDGEMLVQDATAQADAVVAKSDEASRLPIALRAVFAVD